MLPYNTEFNKPTAKCVNALIMKNLQCTPIYEQNHCSQEVALTTLMNFSFFGRQVQCLKLNITYMIKKFRTFKHFLKFLPDAKFDPKT